MPKNSNAKPKQKVSVIPIRVPNDMKQDIERVSQKARLSEADIMRLAIERGIGAVEKMFAKPQEQAA